MLGSGAVCVSEPWEGTPLPPGLRFWVLHPLCPSSFSLWVGAHGSTPQVVRVTFHRVPSSFLLTCTYAAT